MRRCAVIVLAAVILGAVALFGVGVGKVGLEDIGLLETQEAAQRAAEAAAAVGAEHIALGDSNAVVSGAVTTEATQVAGANVTRGSVSGVTATWTSSASQLIVVTVDLSTDHGGYAGPFTASATGKAAVARP